MSYEYWITTAIAVLALLVSLLTWVSTKSAKDTAIEALKLSSAGSVQLTLRAVPQKPSEKHTTWFIQNTGTIPAQDVEVSISLEDTEDPDIDPTGPRYIETRRYSLIPVKGRVSFFLSQGARVTSLRYKTPYSSEVLEIPQQILDTEDLIRRHYREDFPE